MRHIFWSYPHHIVKPDSTVTVTDSTIPFSILWYLCSDPNGIVIKTQIWWVQPCTIVFQQFSEKMEWAMVLCVAYWWWCLLADMFTHEKYLSKASNAHKSYATVAMHVGGAVHMYKYMNTHRWSRSPWWMGKWVLLWAGAVKLGCCPGSNMWCMVDKFSHGSCGPASFNRLHMYLAHVQSHKNMFLGFSGCMEWPGLPCFPLLLVFVQYGRRQMQ